MKHAGFKLYKDLYTCIYAFDPIFKSCFKLETHEQETCVSFQASFYFHVPTRNMTSTHNHRNLLESLRSFKLLPVCHHFNVQLSFIMRYIETLVLTNVQNITLQKCQQWNICSLNDALLTK